MSVMRHRSGQSWRCATPGIRWDCWSRAGWYLWRDGDSWWLIGDPGYVEQWLIEGPEHVERDMASRLYDAMDNAALYFRERDTAR